ncbi:MAG: alpha/beta fold hydrolase [bacterium]
MKLHYRKLGEGRPIVIIHGILGASDNWMYIGRKLDSRFSVYLLDLRNHGRSPHSDEFNYEVIVEDLAEFVADHHLEGPAIIGHSLGGRIAMRFALSNPSAINRLVVVDISPQNRPSANIQFLPDVLETMQRLPLSELQTRKEVDKRLSKVVPDLRERQLLLKNLRRKEDHSFAWKANLEVIRRNMHLVYEAIESDNQFDKPTLFLRGENSDYITGADREKILELFPRARIVTIPKAGHWLHADAPEEVAAAILAFMES